MPYRNDHNPTRNRPATRQWVWSVGFPPASCDDEPILKDVTGDPGYSNNGDPDVADGGAAADRRYFYHQDRNWNVIGHYSN